MKPVSPSASLPRLYLLTLLFFSVLLVACGGGGGGGDTPESTPTPTPTPDSTSNYNVNASAGEGGSIEPSSISVSEGETATFSVTPDTYYELGEVSGCDGALSGATYHTGTVTENCLVTASFTAMDSNGDGLTDLDNARLGTSPFLEDTSGDGLTDLFLRDDGGFSPLIAAVPKLEVSFVGDIDVVLDGTAQANCSFTEGSVSSTLTTVELSHSRTDAESTLRSREEGEARKNIGLTSKFPPSAYRPETRSSSVTEATVQENSTSITEDSASAAQEAFEQQQARTCFDGSEQTGGKVTMGFRIANPSNISYSLEDISLTLIQAKGDRSRESFTTLGTVQPLQGPTVLGPGAETGTLTVEVELPPWKALDLVYNPSGLFFEVGTYDLLDEYDRNFAFIAQTTLSRTALVVLDFGAEAEANPTQRFLVASNVARDDAFRPVGIKMQRVMEILHTEHGIEYTTETAGDSDHKVLASINGVGHDQSKRRYWYVMTSDNGAVSNDGSDIDFDDITLNARDVIRLALVQDTDGDGLMDREEYILGTNPNLEDTNGNGLSDLVEARGWIVPFGDGYRAYPDPTKTDTNGDGCSDYDNYQMLTDPNKLDTDGDGIPDCDDDEPLGGIVQVGFTDLSVTKVVDDDGEKLHVTGTAFAVNPLSTLRVQWGDGTQNVIPTDGDSSQSFDIKHEYNDDGVYDLKVTVEDDQPSPNTASRRFEINWAGPQYSGAAMYDSDGWTVERHPRFLADVNGNGHDDAIGFHDENVYVWLADEDKSFVTHGWGPGNDGPAEWLNGNFGYDNGWDIAPQHESYYWRDMVDMNGDGCADVVVFGEQGPSVALSNCIDGFDEPTIWSTEFVGDNPYGKRSMLADVNNDGLKDLIIHENGLKVVVALNVDGEGFADSITSSVDVFAIGESGWNHLWPHALGDVDGDGNIDMLGFGEFIGWVSLGDGLGGFSEPIEITDEFTLWAAGWNTDDPRYLADINGNGLPDIVGFRGAGVYIAENTSVPGAVGFAEQSERWTTPILRTTVEGASKNEVKFRGPVINPRWVADMNDDGMDDIVYISDEGVTIGFADGEGSFDRHHYSEEPNDLSRWQEDPVERDGDTHVYYRTRLLGDVTGNGRPDVVGFASGSIATFPNFEIAIPVTD